MSHKATSSTKQKRGNYYKIPETERMHIIERACKQVSRGVFFSTIIIITSFLPVFILTDQEGKLFHPLAYTKTFIMAVDAILVVHNKLQQIDLHTLSAPSDECEMPGEHTPVASCRSCVLHPRITL